MRGGQRQVLLLMQGLRNAGHSSLLLARKGGPLWAAAAEEGFSVAPASCRSIWNTAARADLLHVHDGRAHLFASLVSSKPFVVSRRVAFPIGTSFASRWKYRRAARFLAVSQFVASQLHYAGIPASKIEVVYDGVELAERDSQAVARKLAVAIASDDPLKGRFLIENAADEAGVAITFSDHLARDLPQAAQFIYISHSEGLGSAALFAMSHDVAVIASRVGGLPEVVSDRETGLLVQNKSAAIAAAMRELATDPDYAAMLGRNGRKRVEKLFSARRMVECTISAYHSVLAGS